MESARGLYGLMSIMGEPSSASSFVTCKVQFSTLMSSVTHSAIGFGRLGLLQANTPTCGAPLCLLGVTWRMCLSSSLSRRWHQ